MNPDDAPKRGDEDSAGASADLARAAADRDRSAADRDRRAAEHDSTADLRDSRADERDDRADLREEDMSSPDLGARADRSAALRDRQGGAGDRVQSADDRTASGTDRELAAAERATLSVDQLTHAYRREVGVVELTREVVRAQRMEQPFVVAFIDVDHLKERNDQLGHPAGDDLLVVVADAIRAHIRPYDLLIRYGGDEFVCGLPDVTPEQVSKRFERMNADLAASHEASVSFGLAEVSDDKTAEDLIRRADAELYANRQRQRDASA